MVLSELVKGGGKILPVAQQPGESPVKANRRHPVEAGQSQENRKGRVLP